MGRKRIGKYVVDMNDRLGSGSFASVYRGFNDDTKETVAVKIVRKPQNLFNEQTKTAFFEQIKIMMKLKSSNIISLLDVLETKSNYYLILEMANQGDFRKILKLKRKQGQTLTEKQTIKYLVQLLNGFGAMFKLGIIHRDIKPQNIFVKDDKLKIGDFGFAKNNQQLDRLLSTMVGSPSYMAPQILKKQKYSYKCDIWSLGVMTYEMIVGELPFDSRHVKIYQDQALLSEALQKIFNIIVKTQISYPQSIQISSEMKDFIKGCLQVKEENRFDWIKLFKHPIFRGIFSQNFENMKPGQEQIAYIMGSFRMNFNQYSVDIISELQKIKKPTLTQLFKQISISQFNDFLQYLNCEITPEQCQIMINILKKSDTISMKDFGGLMKNFECLPILKPLSNDSILIAERKKMNLVINLIKKANNVKPVKMSELIPKEIMLKEKLDLQDFSNIIKSLVPQVPDYVLPEFKKIVFESAEGSTVPIDWFIEAMEDLVKQVKQEEQLKECEGEEQEEI